MKLRYRGVIYQKTSPSIGITESEKVGKYRGTAWCKRIINPQVVLQGIRQLKYRGIAYITLVWSSETQNQETSKSDKKIPPTKANYQ